MVANQEKKKRVRKGLGEFKRKLKIQWERWGGEWSNGSCHLISGDYITADFFFGPLLPLHYTSVTGEAELLLAGVFNGRVWGAAFMSSITQGE